MARSLQLCARGVIVAPEYEEPRDEDFCGCISIFSGMVPQRRHRFFCAGEDMSWSDSPPSFGLFLRSSDIRPKLTLRSCVALRLTLQYHRLVSCGFEVNTSLPQRPVMEIQFITYTSDPVVPYLTAKRCLYLVQSCFENLDLKPEAER